MHQTSRLLNIHCGVNAKHPLPGCPAHPSPLSHARSRSASADSTAVPCSPKTAIIDMKDKLTGNPIDKQDAINGGGAQADSPGFQIGGKSGGFEAWELNLAAALAKSQGVPDFNPGNSTKTGSEGLYPGGLNIGTYEQLLDRNPIFDTTFN